MNKKTKCYCGHTDYCDCGPLEELKQETLEEAAERYVEEYKWEEERDPWFDFMEGAKWQQEQDKNKYSEEDMKIAFEAGHKKGFSGYPNTENWKELPFKEWFEQFNKTILNNKI